VRALARRWPLGLASSSNRGLIDLVLELAGLGQPFAATVSFEEAKRGKPAPDLYLEAARRLGVGPRRCAAVQGPSNGLRSSVGPVVLTTPSPRAVGRSREQEHAGGAQARNVIDAGPKVGIFGTSRRHGGAFRLRLRGPRVLILAACAAALGRWSWPTRAGW